MMRLALQAHADPEYVAMYLRSTEGRTRLTANAKWAVNQASINQGDVSSTLVPLPDLETQREIRRFVSESLDRVAALNQITKMNHARLDSLQNAILHAAFAGNL
jgi:type I restriction enzyme S subunit